MLNHLKTAPLSSPNCALDETEMRRRAPSIFAMERHRSRSARFTPIPTIEIIQALAKEGFQPAGVKQVKTRDRDRAGFTKHLIRFRRFDDERPYAVGDTVCEILLENANDGTSAYHLMTGLYRTVCCNGLVVSNGDIDDIRVRHSGYIINDVIEGSYRVLGAAQKALAAPAEWPKQRLGAEEREAFAEAAHVLRFGRTDGSVTTTIKPEQLLEPRRSGDRASDLWTTFNVVQENIIRGGLHGEGRNANGRRQRTTTRPVNGINQDVRLNKALWLLAERMAEIKTAA
jgi:hypothetical protein